MASWIQFAFLFVILAATCDRLATQSLPGPLSIDDLPMVFLDPSVASELVQCLQTGMEKSLYFSVGKQYFELLAKSVLFAISKEVQRTRKKAQAFEKALISSLSDIITIGKRQEDYSGNVLITSGILSSCFQERAGLDGKKYAYRLQTLLERFVNNNPLMLEEKPEPNNKAFLDPANLNFADPSSNVVTESADSASAALTASFTDAFNTAVQLSSHLRELFHYIGSNNDVGDLYKVIFNISIHEGVIKSDSKSLAKEMSKAVKSSLKSGIRPNFQYVLSNSVGRFLYDAGLLLQGNFKTLAQDYSNSIEEELKKGNPKKDSTLFPHALTLGTVKFFKSHEISIVQKGYIYPSYFVRELSFIKRGNLSRTGRENHMELVNMNIDSGYRSATSKSKDLAPSTANSFLYQTFIDEFSSSFFQEIAPSSAHMEISGSKIPTSLIRKTLRKYLKQNAKKLELSGSKSVKKITSTFFQGNFDDLKLSSLISLVGNSVAQFLLEKGTLTFQNYVYIARSLSKAMTKGMKPALKPTDTDSYLEAIIRGMVDFMVKQNLSGKKRMLQIASIFHSQYNISQSTSEHKTEAPESALSPDVSFASEKMLSNNQREASEYLSTNETVNAFDNYKASQSSSKVRPEATAFVQFTSNDEVVPNYQQRQSSKNEVLSQRFGSMDTEPSIDSFKSAFAASLANAIASSKSLLKIFALQVPLSTHVSALRNVLQEFTEDFSLEDSIEDLVKSATNNMSSSYNYYDLVMASVNTAAHILSQKGILTTSNTQKLSRDLTNAYLQGIQSQYSVSDLYSCTEGGIRGYLNFIKDLNIKDLEDLFSIASLFNFYVLSTKQKSNVESGYAFKDMISIESPKFFSDNGLHSKEASSRINSVASVVGSALSQSGGKGLNVDTFTTALKSVVNQIQKNSPQQAAGEVLIEGLLESTQALLEVINQSGIQSVDLSKSSNVSSALLTALRS